MLVQWAVVAAYVLAMFFFTRQDVSGAGHTAQLLARLLPHLSGAELRQLVFLLRKAGHVLAYALLTFLVYRAASRTKKLQGRPVLVSMLFSLLVAAGDESFQIRLQHRSGMFNDVLIDGLGISAAAAMLWLRVRLQSKHHKEVVEDNVENECI